MKIQIKSIQKTENGLMVECLTIIGIVKGIWKGSEEIVIGNNYHVELSIHHPDNLEDITDRPYDEYPEERIRVFTDKNTVTFCGIIESKDEDVYYIRYASDWLDMIEIPENAPQIPVDHYIEICADAENILIYPYEMPKNLTEKTIVGAYLSGGLLI